jgi:hypothetical protein
MVLEKFQDGAVLTGSGLYSTTNETLNLTIKNHLRFMLNGSSVYSVNQDDLWGDVYTGANGKNSSVVSATANFSGISYNCGSSDPKIIITAGSLYGTISANSCISEVIYANAASGAWTLRCTTSDYETRRAKLYQTLFADGLVTSKFSGTVTLQTNIARDVGKQATYVTAILNTGGGNGSGFIIGSFSNTTNNINANAWGFYKSSNTAGAFTRLYMPNGNIVGSSIGTLADVNHIGSDRSAFDQINPGQVVLNIANTSTSLGSMLALIMHSGAITWNFATSGTAGTWTGSRITSYSQSLGSFSPNTIYHTIPAGTCGSNISSCNASVLFSSFLSGGSVTYNLSNGSSTTGDLLVNESTSVRFTPFTFPPTTLTVKMNPISGTMGIYGFGFRAV